MLPAVSQRSLALPADCQPGMMVMCHQSADSSAFGSIDANQCRAYDLNSLFSLGILSDNRQQALRNTLATPLKIIKTNITQQVIAFLKKNIENGSWRVNEKIPSENQLTEQLGVSRASVRMAIRQLIALDALTSIQGKGTFVRTNTISAVSGNPSIMTPDICADIHQILEFRCMIEPEAAYIAARNATPQTIQTLHQILERMKDNVGNPDEFVKQDMLFHEEICKATGNSLLENCLKEIFRQKEVDHKKMNTAFGNSDGIYYHTLLLKAFEENNSEKAKTLMRAHLQQAIDRMEQAN
jgi:GntR family transcriptional repressor for pyruvate dehydrogenase complex